MRKKKMPNHWNVRPLLPQNFRDLTYPQARSLFHISPLGDFDKDNVINVHDCRPFDYRRQDEEGTNGASTTDPKLISKLASSPNVRVRLTLTKNPNLSERIYGMLLNDPVPDVRHSVVMNYERRFPTPFVQEERWLGFDAIKKTIDCDQPNLEVIKGIMDAEKRNKDDIISVINYNTPIRNYLLGLGFFETPNKVSWRRKVTSVKDYAESIKKGRDIRRGLNSLEIGKRNQDIKFFWDKGLSREELYRQWYNDIYTKELGKKRRGKPSSLLSQDYPPDQHIGLYAEKKGKLVGGRLIKQFSSTLSASYDAFDKEAGKYLGEIAYAKMMEEALRQGKTVLSLGQDTNFYGYHLGAGIYKSKVSFGFKPRAIKAKGSQMIKVLNPNKFENPYMFLSFVNGSEALRNNIFVRGGLRVNPADYTAPGGVKVWRIK